MTIYHPLSDFLYELFPESKGKGPEGLVSAIRTFYSLGEFVPEVVIEDGIIKVHIDAGKLLTDGKQFQRAVGLCEKGQYTEAKPILLELAKRNPTNSEVHRILGQIASDEGQPDLAIDYLIDALRWNPKNGYALLMMGNVWARDMNDADTASKYYNHALEVDPKNHIAANNIGATFLQLRRTDEAEKWFLRALEINKEYPNTYYGLSMVHVNRGELDAAFTTTIEALKRNKTKDRLWENSLQQAQALAGELIRAQKAASIVEAFGNELASRGGKAIDFVSDTTIPTTAKLEVAENHNRSNHVIRYKPEHPEILHLEMHELEHLRLIIEARAAGVNKLYVTRKEQRANLIRTLEKHVHRLSREGFSEESIASYIKELVEGINRQVYNAPIDLFIEQRLYEDYPTLRPYQFVSMMQLLTEAIQATTDPEVVKLTPPPILTKSKTYNLLLGYQFAELFGIDRTVEFKATPSEKALANKFWDEFLEYRPNRQAGEEYELVQHWGEDQGLAPYFELVDEIEHRMTAEDPLQKKLSEIEADPLDQHSDDPMRAQEMRTFQDAAARQGLNMAVVMYMVDALQHFEHKTKPQIKEAAFEIAMLGTQGIVPDKQGYRLHHVPGKSFTGYHLLAYYYVSWKLAIPEMVKDLHLPYDTEYEMATQLFSKRP